MLIRFSKRSIKFLLKQSYDNQLRIVGSILNLPYGDVIKLRGEAGYRLRVGSFRVLFDKDGYVISIEKIDNRGQVYKR